MPMRPLIQLFPPLRRSPLATSLLALLALGCGGDSTDSGVPTSPPAVTPTGVGAPTTSTTVVPMGGDTSGPGSTLPATGTEPTAPPTPPTTDVTAPVTTPPTAPATPAVTNPTPPIDPGTVTEPTTPTDPGTATDPATPTDPDPATDPVPGTEPPPNPGQPIGFASLNGGTTGGAGGQVVTVSTYADLVSFAESATPYIIMVQGTLSNGPAGGVVDVTSNKSIIGIGSTAFLSGIGIDIDSTNNVILQNLRMSLVGTTTPSSVNGGDNIGIRGTSRNIWIDHCELFSEDPAVQTNIDLYDGLIDIRDETGYITISWNYLHDHHKGGLIGASDTDLFDDRHVTFHHNYYDQVRLRAPMYRGSVGHFFNNYIVGATDATEIRAGTCVRVEKNYYEPLNFSIYTPSDSVGSTERIDNIEVSRATRAYPANCTADIPYSYADVLTNTTADIPTVVPQFAGVGQL